MRLHTLTFQAVGPYPDRHTIDFARLGASGLYLLEGPTGAGKSTIIDAIVYALYGKVAADAASEDRLRSTRVGPGTESYVDLVLETGQGIYRVRRSPAYDRTKQRGTGTTKQQATAKLWRLSTADLDAIDPGRDLGDQTPGTFMSGRADEVGAEITRIVGLSREQLVQTIVLPQGEFASFLRAKPEDRSALLQRVFGTEIYQRVQNRLVEARKAALAARKEADAHIALAAAGLASGLGDDDAAELRALAAATDGSGPLLMRVDEHLVQIEAENVAAVAARDAASAEHATREGVARAARSALSLVTRRDSAVGRLAELEARAEEHAHDTARLGAARRAATVVARLDDVEAADTRRTATAAALADVRAAAAEHPAVATLLAAPDADAAVLAAARGTSATKLEHLVELEAGLAARAATLDQRTGGLDSSAAAAAVVAATENLALATAAGREASTLVTEIAAHDAATEALRARVEAARDAATVAEAAIEADRAALATDSEKVVTALSAHLDDGAGPSSLADVHDDLVEQEELLAAVAVARAADVGAAEHLEATRSALATALAAAELVDATEARAATLDRTSIQALESSTKLYEQQVAAERATLATPEIAALPADVDVTSATAVLEAAESALVETRELRDLAVATAATSDGALARARTGAAEVVTAVEGAADVLEATAPVIRIANLADASTADNASRLTLTTYVLARRFDEVLAAANDRLRQMSSGRYELRRSDAKEKGGGQRLGLALRVRDHSTEDDREPTTLSGGETFYVSLCLALGLADVVTAENGGSDLGTLFVDEGFGSLDPETLELVMTELSHLQAGGRVVGVVSHVDAMKQAIADRISVRRRPDGSSTLDVVAGA